MTRTTQRHIWVCALLVMLATPLAFVTWPTVLGSPTETATAWTAKLSAKGLEEASASVEKYPLAYRRAIMRALSPQKRSSVWTRHIERYIHSHPVLSTSAVTDLRNVVEVFTPDFFSGATPSSDTLSRLEKAARRIKDELGDAEAKMLLEQLGPSDGELSGFNTPSLLTFLRSHLIVQAQASQCECATKSDYCDDEWHCHYFAGTLCYPDLEWPMCGTGWGFVCDGICIPNH